MTYHPFSTETSRKSGTLTTWNPLGHLGLLRETFTLLFISYSVGNAYLSILPDALYCDFTVKLELLTVGLNKPGMNDTNDI